MKTPGMKKRWTAIVLGALVFGAIALVAIVGAVSAQQNSTAQSMADASGANSATTVTPAAQDDAPLLDAWDRAEALHWHGTATPTAEMLSLDTSDGATPSLQNNAHAPTDDLTDLNDRHRPEALNAIIAQKSK